MINIKKLNNIFILIAQLKLYFSRAVTYISIINFLILFATFKQVYNINVSVFVLIPIGVLLALIIGYIDYKLIFAHELEHTNKQNDIMTEIKNLKKMINESDK